MNLVRMACARETGIDESDVAELDRCELCGNINSNGIWSTIRVQHDDLLRKLDNHFAQQKQLLTQVLGTLQQEPVTPHAAGLRCQRIVAEQEWTAMQNCPGEQALQQQNQWTKSVQLPGSTEPLSIVSACPNMHALSEKEPQSMSQPKLTAVPSSTRTEPLSIVPSCPNVHLLQR